MERDLNFLFSDCPDTEIKKCEVVIRIVEVQPQQRFKVKDNSMTAYLQFQDGMTHMSSRLHAGASYRLYSIGKLNQDTLVFKKPHILLRTHLESLIMKLTQIRRFWLTNNTIVLCMTGYC